eukprot:scaffold35328_cov30-Tisochrysis_lutea.AAC.5
MGPPLSSAYRRLRYMALWETPQNSSRKLSPHRSLRSFPLLENLRDSSRSHLDSAEPTIHQSNGAACVVIRKLFGKSRSELGLGCAPFEDGDQLHDDRARASFVSHLSRH